MSGAERLNASTLLDRNLEAGRAGKTALLTADGAVTYGELASLTAAVASYLVDLGVQREQRVLMILDDSPAFPATFLGAMRIGAVPVPVNPMDRVDNYVYYLDDSYARVLVVEASLLPALEPRARSRGPACTWSWSTATRGRTRASTRSRATHAGPSCRRRPTRTARTWRSGSTARARPGGPRASSTRTATSA